MMWTWRKAHPASGILMDTDHSYDNRRFHAYDDRAHAACEPSVGLGRSVEEPNEGSDFCPTCMTVVRTTP